MLLAPSPKSCHPCSKSGCQPAAAAAAAPADSVRPEVFKLLDPTAVKASMDAKNYADVQSRIDQAAAIPALTPYETFVLNRLRVALASTTNNAPMAMTALEAVIESGSWTESEGTSSRRWPLPRQPRLPERHQMVHPLPDGNRRRGHRASLHHPRLLLQQ